MATREAEMEAAGGLTGWAMFAAVMMLLAGCFNIVYGLTAVYNAHVLTVTSEGLIVWDFTKWGWIHIGGGLLLILGSIGLFSMWGVARWFAIFVAAANAVAQVAFITAFPLWTLIVIALDVMVIYNLATHWTPAEQA